MQQSEFEKLIKESEEDLQRIRDKYFPLIKERIITGYNLYLKQFDYSKENLFLNYLHSDLKPQDRHFQELSEILKSEGFLEEIMLINDELVDKQEVIERDADYITKPSWDDPSDMRYFDFEGQKLSREEAKILDEDIIGESLQYDLLIKVKDEKELRKLVDLFKKYASEFKLDKNGRKVIIGNDYVENEYAVDGAYDVPLLVCTNNLNKKPRNLYDFLMVNQFNIYERLRDESIILSTLVRIKSKEFHRALKEKGDKVNYNKKYVLRGFVEEYIDKP